MKPPLHEINTPEFWGRVEKIPFGPPVGEWVVVSPRLARFIKRSKWFKPFKPKKLTK